MPRGETILGVLIKGDSTPHDMVLVRLCAGFKSTAHEYLSISCLL